MRNIIKFVMLFLFTSPANATLVSVGDLNFENTGNTIASGDGYTYSSLSGTGLTSTELLVELANSSSEWFGYSIATSEDADRFTNSLLGGSSSCGATDLYGDVCGVASGWIDDMLGQTFADTIDEVFFMSTQYTPNVSDSEVGLLKIYATGIVTMFDDYDDHYATDEYPQEPFAPINYLLVKAPQSVPEPSAIALMGLGLLGFGVTRRKQKKN